MTKRQDDISTVNGSKGSLLMHKSWRSQRMSKSFTGKCLSMTVILSFLINLTLPQVGLYLPEVRKAEAASGDVILLWDTANGAVPGGWTSISSAPGDAFYGVIPRAAATYAAATAGADTHSHTLVYVGATQGANGTALGNAGTNTTAQNTHTHTWGNIATTGDSNLPPYKHLIFIKATAPATIPANAIAMFDTASLPAGWTRYAALDGKYLRGFGDNLTGGAATHNHTTAALLTSGLSGTQLADSGAGGSGANSHSHTIAAATSLSTASNNAPPFVNVVFASNTSGGDLAFASGLLAMFDAAPPSGWTTVSDAAPWANNFLVGAATFGTTGGSAAHDHGGSNLFTSGVPSATSTARGTTGALTSASNTHTHGVTYTVPADATLPVYRDVIVAKYAGSAPSSLLHNSSTTASTKWGGSWGVAGGKYGAFTCATCHVKSAAPNIKRVRTALVAPNSPTDSFPIQAAAGTVSFLSTSGANSFGDDNRADRTKSNLICEGCHSVTSVHRYNSSTGVTDFNHQNANQSDCISCHLHNKGFDAACDSCHGNPPTASTPGGPTGLANSPFATGSSTPGSHTTHVVTRLYTCNNCHNGYVMPKESTAKPGFGDISIGFSNFGSTSGSYSGQLNLSYNNVLGTGTKNCTNVYCHSPGQNNTGGALGAGDYATVTWGGTAVCGSCHKVTEATGLTSGSHAAHLGAVGVTGCADCHTDAANDASSYNSSNHVNGLTEATGSYAGGGTVGNGYGKCSAAICHDDGTGNPGLTPTWGTVITDCSECHPKRPTSGAHSKHFNSAFMGTGAMTCAQCHNGAVEGTTAPTEHLDTNVDVYKTTKNGPSGPTDLGYTIDKAKGSAYTTCATSYCHGNAMPRGTVSGTTNSPNWAGTSTGCGWCHAMAPLAISAHTGKVATDCISCHNHVNAAGNGFTDASKHIDGIVEAQVDDCTSCHGNADLDGALNGVHAKHTAQSLLTGKKRSLNSYGDPTWWYSVTYVNGEPKFGCGQCHPNTETGDLHPAATGLNVDLDPAGEASIPAGNVKLKNSTQSMPTFVTRSSITCTNVYCHSSGQASPTFKTSPNWYGGANSGNCNECHGNMPATGAHSAHDVTIHNADVYAGDATGGKLAATAVSATNAAHGNATNASTISCNVCHNGTVTVSYNSAGSTCATSCHNSATGSPAIGNEKMVLSTTGSSHVNGTRDVAFPSLTTFKSKAQVRDDITVVSDLANSWTRGTYKSAATSNDTGKRMPTFDGTSCSAVDCHNGKPANWVAPTGNCLLCHASLP